MTSECLQAFWLIDLLNNDMQVGMSDILQGLKPLLKILNWKYF